MFKTLWKSYRQTKEAREDTNAPLVLIMPAIKMAIILDETLRIDDVLERLEESQAKAQRHKSPHAAYALGYYHGVCRRIEDDN